ncbi:diguanylate cyclase [Metabacillus fastidiosus]|uniref:diguanylate cyclase n=1 Tax=Metabacillus fastidiosus TaxID=1458 RepID=UPI002DB78836|nr:diguanylate cyclase [Metabacillus fastidiosus]MEC2074623.1 diguanylate cyclase [Metabacillus fastidiosus]
MKLNPLGKLGNRLLSSIIVSALIIVILVITCTVSVRLFLNINIQGQRALDSIEESANNLFKSLIDQETGQRGYNLTKDSMFLEPYYEGRKMFLESSKDLREEAGDFPDLYIEVKQVVQKGEYWQQNYGEPLVDLTLEGKYPTVQLLREGKKAFDDFRYTNSDFSKKVEAQRSNVRNTMNKRINMALTALVIILIGIIFINLLINYQILKSVIKPIIELSSSVKCYTDHNFSKGIPVYRKRDELFELIKNIDLMRTELSQSITSLKLKVNYDELTGLYNRRYFNEFIITEWELAKKNSFNFSLILFDIDHYKNFNDTYGHLAGDECLKTISECIQVYNAEPLSFAARYGGEEFVVLLPQGTEREALSVAENIKTAILDLEIPHRSSLVNEYVTVSIGVASIIPIEEMEPNEIISMADEALYKSKQNGRNKVTKYMRESQYSDVNPV